MTDPDEREAAFRRLHGRWFQRLGLIAPFHKALGERPTLLSETGQSIGAIQIAGTAQVTQLPFFVAACDYTMLGEELFAASAYLSKDPLSLGSIKGQDMMKVAILAVIVIGVVMATAGVEDFVDWFAAL